MVEYLYSDDRGDMMENEYKKQSPYRGFWVIMLILILVPLGLYSLVNAALEEYSPYSAALDSATARALGCGFGFLFHMICILSGVLTAGWQAVKYRICEFFENLAVGVGYACTSYLEDMRDDGVTFILYAAVIAANFAIMADGIRDAIALL